MKETHSELESCISIVTTGPDGGGVTPRKRSVTGAIEEAAKEALTAAPAATGRSSVAIKIPPFCWLSNATGHSFPVEAFGRFDTLFNDRFVRSERADQLPSP